MRKSYSRRIKSVFAMLAVVWIAGLLCGIRVGAQRRSELSPREKRGKQIYLKGESESGSINAVLANGDLEVSASAFPCANCHGLRGEGSNEKGLQTPPIIWRALTSPRQLAPAWQDRRRYDEAAIARAITSGIDSNGGKIHPAMPRYKLSSEQTADLIAYLKRFGDESDSEVGLSDDVIKVGAALPMTGPFAGIGHDLKQTLGAYFTEVNKQGGIYGRKFELVIADSHGDPVGTDDVTRLLVEKEGVFALVGSFQPGNSQATSEFLKKSEVPLIGPVTLSPLLPPLPNRFVFYLLPSFNDQTRSLIDFIAADETRSRDRSTIRLVAVYSDNGFDQDALTGLRAQAKTRSMQIAAEQSYDSASLSAKSIVAAVAAQKPDYIFFFGNGDDFGAFAREMDRLKLEADLMTCASMVGRSAFGLPARVASRTYLSYPASFPEEDDSAEFLGVMQKGGVQLRSAAFQAVAYAGAKIFVEAVKSSGRKLNRAALLNSLEHLQNFRTGVLPPVTFSPNRRIGVTGSYIVSIDVAKKRFLPLGNRIVPKDSSQ